MKALKTRLILLAGAALLLSACDTPREKAEKAADQTNAGQESDPTAQEQALIDATPQVSLSAEDREKYRTLAREYLDDAVEMMAEQGYTPAPGFRDEMVAMLPTQKHEWKVSLKRGETYRIVGVCDNECQDLDLELVDRSGKIVERDSLPDDFPILNIAPANDADYTARLVMKTCEVAPCFAGTRVFWRTGPPRAEAEDSQEA